MIPHQASCIAIGARAMLIEGPPGIGKSSLALALIDRGATLIGDDSVMLEARNGHLVALPHPNTRGVLELRNIGLVNYAVCEEAPLALIVRLDENAPRYIEAADSVLVCGVSLPMIRLWPGGSVLHLRAEAALARYGLNGSLND